MYYIRHCFIGYCRVGQSKFQVNGMEGTYIGEKDTEVKPYFLVSNQIANMISIPTASQIAPLTMLAIGLLPFQRR